jgi:hypothetical protein
VVDNLLLVNHLKGRITLLIDVEKLLDGNNIKFPLDMRKNQIEHEKQQLKKRPLLEKLSKKSKKVDKKDEIDYCK